MRVAHMPTLGRRVGLTPPAVADRIRRLEVAGIITGYHAAVNPAKLGLGLTAIIRFNDGGAYERIMRVISSALRSSSATA